MVRTVGRAGGEHVEKRLKYGKSVHSNGVQEHTGAADGRIVRSRHDLAELQGQPRADHSCTNNEHRRAY